MKHSSEYVEEFHREFGHPVAEKLTVGTEELRLLRVKLIAEELCELCQALGVDLLMGTVAGYVSVKPMELRAPDMLEAADALGDLDYVVQGAGLVFGIPMHDVVAEIHRSNMSKLGEDGNPIYREDGKILKGPNYSPPDLEFIYES